MLRLGIVAAAVVCWGAAACAAPEDHGPHAGLDIKHYDVWIRLDPPPRSFSAAVTLTAQQASTQDRIVLDAGDLRIRSVEWDGVTASFEKGGSELHIQRPPGAGSQKDTGSGPTKSQIEIRYEGWPEVGLYQATHDGVDVLYTDAWPDRGRGWLPGHHHPSDPATWHLTLDLPLGAEAVASGAPGRVDTLGPRVHASWSLETPAPTYALAFAVADFTVAAAGDSVAYAMLAPDAEQADQLARTPQALRFFTSLLGPYPYGSYTSAQVPIRYAGMENAAAPFLQARLFDQASAEPVQVHELAHQWLGNAVTIADWNELWLSEGMATYLTTRFYAHADGPAAARERLIDHALLPRRDRAAFRPLVPTPGQAPASYLHRGVYDKGACVLHGLRLLVGEATFVRVLRQLAADRERRLSTPRLRGLLEAESGLDLSAYFAYWVYGSRLPQLVTDWEAASRTLRWRVEDDAGTLAGLPFQLLLSQGSADTLVTATDGIAVLRRSERPTVEPVGIMVVVR